MVHPLHLTPSLPSLPVRSILRKLLFLPRAWLKTTTGGAFKPSFLTIFAFVFNHLCC